jgi:hypothetical protein
MDIEDRPEDRAEVPDNSTLSDRKAWQEPKLTFLEPTLTPHGELTTVTGQFFGAFSPPPED